MDSAIDATQDLAMATGALLTTYLILFYPVVRPYVAQYVPALTTPLWENLFLPIMLYRCLEISALMATPSVGALTPIIVIVGYLFYLQGFRCITDYVTISEAQGQTSSSDETDGTETTSSSSESDDQAEAVDAEQAEAVGAEPVEIDIDNAESAEIDIPPVMVEGQNQEDVFTVLEASKVTETQHI